MRNSAAKQGFLLKDTIIEAKGVSVIYEMGEHKVYALREIDFAVKKGEYVAITGPSGSGKTTLLDVLSCLHSPTEGEVFIKGKSTSQMSSDELAGVRGRTIGFVFQTFNLIPRLTALGNVMLPLWFNNVPIGQRKEIAGQALEEVGLSDRMNHKPNELSGGQKQRVAIARALAVNPDIIVGDEPTGNLDSQSGENVLELLEDLHKKHGKTIMLVTHERYVAERAEKIIHIKDGRITEIETGHKKAGKAKAKKYRQ